MAAGIRADDQFRPFRQPGGLHTRGTIRATRQHAIRSGRLFNVLNHKNHNLRALAPRVPHDPRQNRAVRLLPIPTSANVCFQISIFSTIIGVRRLGLPVLIEYHLQGQHAGPKDQLCQPKAGSWLGTRSVQRVGPERGRSARGLLDASPAITMPQTHVFRQDLAPKPLRLSRLG